MSRKMFNKNHLLLLILGLVCIRCSQPPGNKATIQDVVVPQLEERVFVVNIVPDEKKLEEYLNYHQHIWPEMEAGFKKAGYRKITLSRFKHLIVMSIVVPKGADLDSMSKVAEQVSIKCAKWNRVMARYQMGVPGTKSGQKWVEVKPFYEFENK